MYRFIPKKERFGRGVAAAGVAADEIPPCGAMAINIAKEKRRRRRDMKGGLLKRDSVLEGCWEGIGQGNYKEA
jgi:hypothetical protein